MVQLQAAVKNPNPEPVIPGDAPVLPDGRCNGCEWGWERYRNPNGIWLHRNATDTLGTICAREDDE